MPEPRNNYTRITTDDTLRETLSHGSSRYPFAYYLEDIWQFDFHRIDWHWHHEVEFVYVRKGTIFCLVGEERIPLSEGCAIFVNSSYMHRYEAEGATLIPNVLFSPSLLAPEDSLLYEKYIQPVLRGAAYQLFDRQTDWQARILQLLSVIFELQENDTKNELQTLQYLLELWGILYEHIASAPDTAADRTFDRRQARLQLMMQYIHDHYREPVTLEEIASAASLGKSSALHIFQSGIHITPVAYLIQYRLTRAAWLLCTTGKTVSVIAEETGFANAGYFCRKFKEQYQKSPNTYRSEKTQS